LTRKKSLHLHMHGYTFSLFLDFIVRLFRCTHRTLPTDVYKYMMNTVYRIFYMHLHTYHTCDLHTYIMIMRNIKYIYINNGDVQSQFFIYIYIYIYINIKYIYLVSINISYIQINIYIYINHICIF
jgi:hypothetical protein